MTTPSTEELQRILVHVRTALSTLKAVNVKLEKLGYKCVYVSPDLGDGFTMMVHPDYIELFNKHYDPFAGWDPSLNVPEWAAMCTTT